MHIAIIGAGFTGLAAAYQLVQNGHTVTLFEKDHEPGGLALGFTQKNWQWSLEKHYHHWFTNDAHILHLAQELNYPVIVKRPKTSVYVGGTPYQLDSLLSVLQFPKLSPVERIRMAGALGALRYSPVWRPLEHYRTADILPRLMGQKAYDLLWEPQLVSKFGAYKNEISLAWFWARVHKRTPSLAYPEGGFLQFAQAITGALQKRGVKTFFDTEVQAIQSQKNKTTLHAGDKTHQFDKLIVTLPSFFFLKIAPQLPDTYKQALMRLKGLGAINLILRLKKQFLIDNTYWLSVCDKDSPIMAVVEHTNFMDKKYYDNEHLVYLGNYLPADHRYFKLKPAELLKTYHPFLQKLHPGYTKDLIGYHLFAVPFAQPIIPIHYSQMIPPFETPLPNVYLANMQQVYPWDRGTNYAVELGEKIANKIS